MYINYKLINFTAILEAKRKQNKSIKRYNGGDSNIRAFIYLLKE